ncbi:TetR/AcrR family transcriptional regulator [Actinomadura madurae]|uniref:TetR/AcrR family transcriptional regulator n=1 Tax=Actinomadura madurae TaxID=1993 RepID=UPI0020D259E8|nr:TetR/AcrR family transcriptional regulator [Actinomadura madurae]MCP9969180.1 TetR/AcrR family transcriptional regulator [Actinomadura madurae]
MSRSPEGGRTSEARARLLGTATRIFYAEGIHSVGVDRIIAEAQVTRATLYRHFSGKEDLVLAYLDQADKGIRAQIGAAQASGGTAADKVRAVGTSITEGIRSPGFRGCAFLNAAAEYPDPAHPIHQAVLAHRQWFLNTVTDLLAQVGDAPADLAGRASRHAQGRRHGGRLPVRPETDLRDLPPRRRGHSPGTPWLSVPNPVAKINAAFTRSRSSH